MQQKNIIPSSIAGKIDTGAKSGSSTSSSGLTKGSKQGEHTLFPNLAASSCL